MRKWLRKKESETLLNDIEKTEASVDEVNQNSPEPTEKNLLAGYSVKEIEYARVWLEVLGTETKEILVGYHSRGTAINRYEEEESAVYSEDVVVLSGNPFAAGLIIYSSNGNGTINKYDVPSHWQRGVIPEDQSVNEFTTRIAENPTVVKIAPHDDEEVKRMIEKLNIEN